MELRGRIVSHLHKLVRFQQVGHQVTTLPCGYSTPVLLVTLGSPGFVIIQRQKDSLLEDLFPGHMLLLDIVLDGITSSGVELVRPVVQYLARVGLELVGRQNDITVAVVLAVAAGNGNLKNN